MSCNFFFISMITGHATIKVNGRKKRRQPEKWKQNLSKKRRDLGLAGEGVSGKKFKARCMRPPCHCRSKCYLKPNLNDGIRLKIFQSFWNKGDHDRQLDYVFKYTKISAKKQPKPRDNDGKSRRNFSRTYFLPLPGKNSYSEVKCCKTMFLNTLGKNISE